MIGEAQAYVGTDWTCGAVQLELLKRSGCQPTHNVLELGCGCLSAGVPILKYLTTGKYVGVEPNRWLVEAALSLPGIPQMVQKSGARFLFRDDFDSREANETFDFVLAHSVLSHCAFWQVSQFVGHAAAVLKPRGSIVASFRMAEGNLFGSAGSDGYTDTSFAEWQYPGVAWYSQQTICEIAHQYGLIAMLRPDYTRILTATVPKDFHDWMVFRFPRQ